MAGRTRQMKKECSDVRSAMTVRAGRAMLLALALVTLLAVPVWSAEENNSATNRMDGTTQARRGRFGGPERGVYKAQISPHWFQENLRFWYRNDLRDGAKEFVVVDAEHGTRQPAFDRLKLS